MEKRIKLFIKVCLIILIITICVFIIYKNYNSTIKSRKYNIMGVYKDPNIYIEKEKNIVYKNIDVLKSLKGELPASTVTKKIKNIFLSNIPDIMDEVNSLNEDELKLYYENNKEKILENIRVDNEISFFNMVKKFKDINCNLREDYNSCTFIEAPFIKIEFKYENKEIVECNIKGKSASIFKLEF